MTDHLFFRPVDTKPNRHEMIFSVESFLALGIRLRYQKLKKKITNRLLKFRSKQFVHDDENKEIHVDSVKDIGAECESGVPSSIPARSCFIHCALIPLEKAMMYHSPAMG